jgi:hypothetical protein
MYRWQADQTTLHYLLAGHKKVELLFQLSELQEELALH